MKKTISTNDQDGHIFFKLEPNDKETVRMIDKTIQRFPNLSIEGHVTNIDKENGNIEIQLTTPSEHPEIKVAVKLFLEIIKRKNSNKSKKRIRGNTRKRKQLISKNLPNLIKKHGKNAILSHIVDQIEKSKGKLQTQKDYLTLFFMIEKDISPKALDYVSICLKLKQFKDGMNFCKKELVKNHHPAVKDILTFYLIQFSKFAEVNYTEKDIIEIIKKTIECMKSPFLKDILNSVSTEHLKELLIRPLITFFQTNLHQLIREGQLQFTINGIIQTMNQCREVTPPDSNLLTTNRHLLLQLYRYSLTPEQFQQINEEVMRDIQDFTFNEWLEWIPCTQHPLTVHANRQTTLDNVKPVIDNSSLQQKEKQLMYLVLASASQDDSFSATCLSDALNINHPPHYGLMLQTYIKYPTNTITQLIQTETRRSTPYGNISWLLRNYRAQFPEEKTLLAKVKISNNCLIPSAEILNLTMTSLKNLLQSTAF